MIIGIVWRILFGKTILLSIVIPVHAFTGISGLYPSMEIGPESLKTPETEGMVFVKGRCIEMGYTINPYKVEVGSKIRSEWFLILQQL